MEKRHGREESQVEGPLVRAAGARGGGLLGAVPTGSHGRSIERHVRTSFLTSIIVGLVVCAMLLEGEWAHVREDRQDKAALQVLDAVAGARLCVLRSEQLRQACLNAPGEENWQAYQRGLAAQAEAVKSVAGAMTASNGAGSERGAEIMRQIALQEAPLMPMQGAEGRTPSVEMMRAMLLSAGPALEGPLQELHDELDAGVQARDQAAVRRLTAAQISIIGGAVAVAVLFGVLWRAIRQGLAALHTATAALRESNDLFEQMAAGAADSFAVLSAETRQPLYLSPAHTKIFGTAAGKGSDMFASLMERVAPEDRSRVLAAEAAFLAGGAFDERYRILRPDGTMRWLHHRRFTLRDAQGKLFRYIGIIRDVTAAQQTEAALWREKLLSDSLFDCFPGLFAMFDSQGRYLRGNAMCEKVFGLTQEELAGIGLLDRIAAEDRPAVAQAMAAVFQEGTADVEGRLITKDGRMPVVMSGRRIEVDGKACLVGCAIDITRRKAMEDELYRSQQMLQLVLDNVPQRIFWKDRESRYMGCNRIFAQDSGVGDPGAIVGKTDEELPWREYLAGIRKIDRDVMETGQAIRNIEKPSILLAGSERWSRMSIVPLCDRAERTIGVLGTYEDITERRQSQEELRQALMAAERATRAKSEFLANMSHEIRTPMTAILGYADTLMDGKQMIEERQKAVEVIRRNGEHLLAIINDILDLSKIESGRMEVERREASLSEIVHEAASTIQGRAKEKGLAFEVSCGDELPQTIHTDPMRLRQILVNLLGNAIKFTEKGRVELKVRAAPGVEGALQLEFQVSDTGVGIAPDQVGRLFYAFGQADGSTTRQFGGTGLGLAISRHFAQLLGGDIAVASAPGCGSTFTLRIEAGLPETAMVSPGREIAAAKPAARVAGPLAGRILLAEDGRDNQAVVTLFLRHAGLATTVAENGRVACEMARAARDAGAPFDVILMDMQMPELDGYGATARLRAEGFGVPIIALTAHAMAEDRARCLAAGCSDYMSKPIRREELIAAVARHLAAVAPE